LGLNIVELEPASTWHPYRSEMSISRLAVPSLREDFLC
jgi:hypothetical protein